VKLSPFKIRDPDIILPKDPRKIKDGLTTARRSS
jgi:hypothetical protein